MESVGVETDRITVICTRDLVRAIISFSDKFRMLVANAALVVISYQVENLFPEFHKSNEAIHFECPSALCLSLSTVETFEVFPSSQRGSGLLLKSKGLKA